MPVVLQHRIKNGLTNEEVECKKLPVPQSPEELFRLHTLAAFIGHRGSGKTNACIQLAKRYLDEKCFTRIFIICPTYESNPQFHVLEADEKDVFKDLHHALKSVETICDRVKEDADQYKHYRKYCQAYRRWKRNRASEDDMVILDNNQRRPPPNIPRPSPLLIIDDMSHSDLYTPSKKNAFINLVLRHRHLHQIGMSIFMLVQTFKTGLPKVIRQNVQLYCLWATQDMTELDGIYSEVANLVDKPTFLRLYHAATDIPHSFLTIDLANKNRALQFRREFDTYLYIPQRKRHKYLDDSDDDNDEEKEEEQKEEAVEEEEAIDEHAVFKRKFKRRRN